jgi:hypothetical protein
VTILDDAGLRLLGFDDDDLVKIKDVSEQLTHVLATINVLIMPRVTRIMADVTALQEKTNARLHQ